MNFEPKITLDGVAFLVVAAGALMKFGRIETKVDLMFKWFQEHVMSGEAPEPRRRRVSGD